MVKRKAQAMAKQRRSNIGTSRAIADRRKATKAMEKQKTKAKQGEIMNQNREIVLNSKTFGKFSKNLAIYLTELKKQLQGIGTTAKFSEFSNELRRAGIKKPFGKMNPRKRLIFLENLIRINPISLTSAEKRLFKIQFEFGKPQRLSEKAMQFLNEKIAEQEIFSDKAISEKSKKELLKIVLLRESIKLKLEEFLKKLRKKKN